MGTIYFLKHYYYFVGWILLLLGNSIDLTDSFLLGERVPTSRGGTTRMPPTEQTTTTPSLLSSPTSVLFAQQQQEDPKGNNKTTLGEERTTTTSTSFISSQRSTTTPMMDPRSCILRVGAAAGKLCQLASNGHHYRFVHKNDAANANCEEEEDSLLTRALAELFTSLWLTTQSLKLDWQTSIRSKMDLNAKKYPVEHCKGKAGKYTNYSHLTGITTTNQSTMEYTDNQDKPETTTSANNNNDALPCSSSLSDFARDNLPILAEDIRQFAEDRLWSKYHKPRNLVMALLGEVGELSEILQWEDEDWDVIDGEQEQHLLLVDKLHASDMKRLDELSQEIADVSIYAIRLATVCGLVEDLVTFLVQQEEEKIQQEQPSKDDDDGHHIEAKQLF